MNPWRWLLKLQRRQRRTHRTVTITRTVSRDEFPMLHEPADPGEPVIVEQETVETDEPPTEEAAVDTALAVSGGFVAGVLASLVAGLIVLAIERAMHRKDDDR